MTAKESGLSENYLNKLNTRDEEGIMRDLYLGYAPAEYAIAAQRQAIQEVAKHESCVIVDRAADYVLRKRKDVLRVFISAPDEYRIKKLKEMYGDKPAEAKKSIKKSDANRSSYYNTVSGLEWDKRENYDLCVGNSIGNEATADRPHDKKEALAVGTFGAVQELRYFHFIKRGLICQLSALVSRS